MKLSRQCDNTFQVITPVTYSIQTPNQTLKQSNQTHIFKYFIESQLYLEVTQFIPTSHLVKAIAALKRRRSIRKP